MDFIYSHCPVIADWRDEEDEGDVALLSLDEATVAGDDDRGTIIGPAIVDRN